VEFALVLLFTLATVAIIALRLAPRMAEGRVVFDHEPDRPQPFGYNMAWLAIRSRDTGDVIQTLGLTGAQAANWASGLGTVYDGVLGGQHVFVTPPINGWTLVAGHSLPHPSSRRFVDKTLPLMTTLSQRFIEVQYFASYPQVDFFAWARVIDGRLVRAFAINDVGVVWNRGRPTKEEKALGLKLIDVRGVKGRKGDAGDEIVLYPTEQHLMQLALKWSLDPTRLGPALGEPALGAVALPPASWRPERVASATAAA
jgi:hypothetical protein